MGEARGYQTWTDFGDAIVTQRCSADVPRAIEAWPHILLTQRSLEQHNISIWERNMTVLTLVRADDWEGIYVGDKLACEGHYVELTVGIALAIEHKATGIKTVWRDWIHDRGDLPQNLADVKIVPQ